MELKLLIGRFKRQRGFDDPSLAGVFVHSFPELIKNVGGPAPYEDITRPRHKNPFEKVVCKQFSPLQTSHVCLCLCLLYLHFSLIYASV